jgi:ribonuclease BN (tRNA processing enzyme)
MRLIVVGSASAWSRSPGRASSSYLVAHGSTTIVLDLGQGAFSETWRYGSFGDVAAIFISHMHADHNVDLIPLRHWAKYENRGYGPALYGPTQLRSRIGGFQADPDFLADLHGEAVGQRTFSVGDLHIEAAPVRHIPDSWAFRVSAAAGDGAGLVYSGDCAEPDDLLPLIRRGDTLLSEAGFGAGEREADIHLTAAEAAGAAARGGASRLVLTHIQEGRDPSEARAAAENVLGREVEVARPGLEVDIR